MNNYDDLKVLVRMSIIKDGEDHEGTLGKGVVSLLQGIIDYGSLNRAAKNIGMAYSKAWRILKETEAGFGFLLVDRDGARGSTLTPAGVELVGLYHNLQRETVDFANRRFREEIAKIDH